ncbi:hypothetical protein GMMP15_720023 [Candidatus Magnetomoraceae bacterium gMMP-15]
MNKKKCNCPEGKCLHTCKKCRVKAINELSKSGIAAGNEGRMDEAESKLRSALAQAKDIKIRIFEAKIQNNLGNVCSMKGDWKEASTHYKEAMALAESKIGTNNFFYATIQKNFNQLPQMPSISRVIQECRV